MSDMDVGVILSSGEEGVGVEDYQSRDLHLQTSGCDDPSAVPQLLTSVPHHNTKTDGSSGSEKSMNGSGSRRLGEGEQRRMVDITRDKPVKVTVRVVVPVRDHPKFNFVGKLLGPKGNSLKRLQEDTMTKMAILGKGSMRDKHKEEELRSSGDPKFSHLSDDLHVEITAFAPPAEAHARIAYALAEVRRFLVPDYNDEIRQEQMWEMQILNTQRGGKPGGGVEAEIHMGGGGAPDSNNSTASSCSNGSMTPPPPAAPTQLVCRKRPLLPGGGTRLAMSPTKRTVLSILARARAAQGKELPDYHPVTNGRSGTISLLREDGMQGGNLV